MLLYTSKGGVADPKMIIIWPILGWPMRIGITLYIFQPQENKSFEATGKKQSKNPVVFSFNNRKCQGEL
jgi:hypothetical protein